MAMEWRELGIENWINTLTKSHYLFVLVGNRIWRERVLNLSILLELVVSQNFLGEFYEHLKLSLSYSLQVHTPSGTSLAPEGPLLAEIGLSRLINILSSYSVLRASPEVLSIWPWTLKLDEENSKHAVCLSTMVLAQHFCTVCWGWLKAQQNCAHGREECK
jgi:hypothetical protein